MENGSKVLREPSSSTSSHSHEQTPVSPPRSVVNPTTGKLLTKVSEGTSKDVDLAVAAAQKAFDTVWGLHTSSAQRGKLLNKLADIMESRFDELCAVEALDNGPFYSSYLINPVTDNPGLAGVSHRQDLPMG